MEKFKSAEKKLLADTIEKCLINGVKVQLLPRKTLRRASGWVNDTEFMSCFSPKMGYNENNWGIFVHESCHIDQMLDKKSIWYDEDLQTEKDWLDLLTRKKVQKSKKIEKYFKKTLELELDCEKRAVKKIKEYGLNINVKDYIKRGNIYLFSYYCFYHQKCWYDSKFRIYDQTEIIEQMPIKYLTVEDYWVKNRLVWDCLKKHNNF
jgi:hypothetical protein